MPSKSRYLSAQKDDLIWQQLEEDSDAWYASICTSETNRKVANFILKHKDVKPESMHKAVSGGYNVVYRLEFEDKTSLIMRVPIRRIIPWPYRLRKLRN